MKRGLVVIFVLLSFLLLFTGGSFADDDEGNGGGTLRISKAEWNQAKQKLKVKATEGSGHDRLTVHYGGSDFQMQYKKDKKRYELKVKPACYAQILTVDSSSGASAAKSVKVKHGNGEGFSCSDNGGGSGGGSTGGGSSGGGNGTPSRDIVVIATNDLGMHCTCPTAETFVVLPPFNTLRAQVFERKGENPDVLSDPSDIRVEYRIVENTDESLKNDPYFKGWIEFGPKLFPGKKFLGNDGRIHGLTGATLSGKMDAQNGWWEVTGVPAFPALDPNGVENDPIDPVNGAKRNPYLTAVVDVYDQNTNELLASTSTVVPVAFGGCCNCHLQVAKDHGRPGTPRDSFEVMGMLHQQNGSGIDISKIDPDGDGIGGPIRCSQCHLDPAMGETVPPGIPGYPTSDKTFSEVVHKFHAESSAVAQYDPDIAKNCYQCHPGNGVNCFRGQHKTKGLWCTDCHGDLNQRIAQNQLKKPWSAETLPKCEDCHYNTGEGGGYQHVFGGSFLNSMGHKDNKVLCSTCHGTPHGLSPSTLARENDQNMALQGDPRAIGKCDVCHNGKSNIWMVPPHKGTPGYNGGGSGGSGGGTGGTIDVANELATTCLKCHGDRRSKVNCGNGKWMGHDGSKVSSAVFAAVSTSLTGSNCGSTGGSGGGGTGGGTGGTIDVANELATTCLKCHGDRRSKVNCGNGKWMGHDGSKVSSAVFVAVSTSLTGSNCGSTGGSGGGGTGGTINVANELATTCLQCHHDKSSKVKCSKGDWRKHDGSRVSHAVYVAVSTALTGSDCGSTGGGNYGEEDD